MRERGYYYYTRFKTGQDYPVVARKPGSLKAKEQVMLDEPAMAKGHGFFSVGDRDVSQNNRLLAYALDTVGRRQYTLKVKDLATGKTLPDDVANVEPNLVWADDNRTIYYVEKDPVTLLSKRVKAHVLGTPASADKLVYEEKDDTFYMGVGRTSDDKYICIDLQSTVSNEQRCTSAARPGEWSRARAARARVPLRSRPCRQPLDHPHQRRGSEELQAGGSSPTPMQRAAASAWRDLVPHRPARVHREFPAVRQLHRDRGARGRQQAHPPAQQFGTEQRRRFGRAGLCDGHRRQSRSERDQAALHL